ncbi:beta-1,3-galactosyltransferase 5 [Lycorma delicatula]|uniref:beta-1,3-galactosyltransferase 5 n=1 Tax=Lycorma delicatula TaxID=130591 RepID=UPI003F516288
MYPYFIFKKMYKIQYLKLIMYSKTKHIICNLTQFEPIMVWKQFLFSLFLLTLIIVIIFLFLGDDISSDPLIKLIVVPQTEKDISFIKNADYNNEYEPNKLIDILDFKYLIKPSCNLNTISKILLVTSYAGNVESRSALRRAYPESVLGKLGIKRIFLLALLKENQSEVTQSALLNENQRYSDLLQGSFYEAYRNLTYKHTMGLKWVTELKFNCNNNNNIEYIIKMDDDIIVDLYKLITLIDNYDKDHIKYDMMGYVLKNVRPIRIKANKWYVTKNEFDENVYPKFLSGWMYVTRPNIAKKLVKLSYIIKYFWIDDVYITGILGNMIKAKYKDIHDNFTLYPEFFECCIRDNISCYIIAGPNGGDNDLQIKYEKHIKKCIENNCPKLSFSKHECITQRKTPSIGKGFAELKTIKL